MRAMTTELNKLGVEISAMMRDYNERKRKLIEAIDKHGVEAGDYLVIPDECDHLFDEGCAMLNKIEEKLDKILEKALLAGDQDAVKAAAVCCAVTSENKRFFDHVNEMHRIRDKPSTPQ